MIFAGAELIRNKFFAKGFSHSPDAMQFIVDVAGMPINFCSADLTFIFVNKAHAALHGLTPEEIIGKRIVDVLGPEATEAIRPYYELALRGEQVRYEKEVNFKMGRRYIECIYNPVFDDDGKVSGWVGVINDMTQRHQLEKALQENEVQLKEAVARAEKANQAKSDFLANMSHEIRTPMNAIVGLSNILTATDPLTDKQREFIKTLQLSAHSLLSLLNDLLDISKIETNHIDLEYIPFKPSEIIAEIMGVFSVLAREKGIALHYQDSPAANLSYCGDPLRIRQIITNFVSNAMKFTAKGSVTINLTTSPHTEPRHVYLHIGVKDTGIGIPANKHKTIFDKFTQADMSITRHYGGTGLGLAISKNLAELMEGGVTVNSTVGQGSEFALHIPLEYAEEHKILPFIPSQDKSDEADDKSSAHYKILLVEDYSANVLVATTLLEGLGHGCDVARNGIEALEKIKDPKNRYDLILMDVEMPELDGYSTTRILRREENKNGRKRIPVIGVTAHVLAGDREKCIEAGMDDYLTKPFDPDKLKQKIENWAAGK